MPLDNSTYIETELDLDTFWGRLRHLADFMEQLPPSKIEMRDFWCGSAGCALGWASRLPEFELPHLHRRANGENIQRVYEFFGLGEDDRPDFMDTLAKRRHAFGAGEQFHYQGGKYTPADVARHLRETADALLSAAKRA